MIPVSPLCVTRQFGSVVQLHINSYKQEHDTLHWYKQGNEEHESSIRLYSSTVALNEFADEGYYVFYTTSPTGESSVKVKIYILCENIAQQIDSTLACAPANIPDKKLPDELRKKLKSDMSQDMEQRISALIFKYFAEAGDIVTQRKNSFYYEAFTAERYENMQNKSWNQGVSEDFSLDYLGEGTLHTNGFFDEMVITTIDGRFVKKTRIYNQYDIPLKLSKPGAYIIRLYIEKDLVNELVFLRFSDETCSNQWNIAYENNCLLDRISNECINNMTKTTIEMTDEEMLAYSTERQVNLQFPLLPRLIVEPIDTTSDVKITVPSYKMLLAMNKPFYICTKEKEMLFNNYFDGSTLLKNEVTNFSIAKNLIVDDCYFFLKDHNGNMINKLQLYSPAQDLSQYNNRVRLFEIETYRKRMIPVVNYRVPGCEKILDQYFTTIENDSDIFPENAWLEVCRYAALDSTLKNRNVIISAICEEFNNNQRYDENFFDIPITYYYSEDRIVFPPKENNPYTLVVHSIDYGSNVFETDYVPSDSGAIEFFLYNKSRYIIYAINNQDYSISGLIYASSEPGNGSIEHYNLNFAVK